MKHFKLSNYFLGLAALASLFTFNACDKDEDKDGQRLTLSFHQHVGDDELVLNQTYQTADSVTFTITRINYYLSGIKMQTGHGGTASDYVYYDSVYIFVNENTADVELGEIPAGGTHGLEFAIGVEDSAVNHSDPATYPASHALAPKTPTMNWGWATGYLFFVLEGQVDTDNDGTVDTDLSWHIGLDKNLTHHDSHLHFDVVENTDVTLSVKLDVLKVFEGIDLTTENMTHSMGAGDALAMKIAANLPDAFNVE